MPIQEATIQAGPYSIFYRSAGSGRPPVVLLHGIPTNSYLWQGVMPYLESGYVAVAPDLVGYGRSSRAPASELTLPRQAQHVVALLDALGIQQAHVVGHDLGGGIAQILAVRHPERVLSLTVVDGVCFSNWPLPQVVAMRWPPAPEFAPSSARVGEMLQMGVHNPQVLTADAVQALTAPYTTPEGPADLQRAAAALEHHQTEELVPFLSAIQVPTLVLWGQYDRFLPAYWGWKLHQAIPGSQLHVLPRCGHFCMLDNPELVARALLAHLDRTAPVPARGVEQPAAVQPQPQ